MADFPPITGVDQSVDGSSPSQPAQEVFPEFGGYKIIQELPRGGQALVYKAIQKATNTKVALKVLSPGLLVSSRARRRFEREVDLISGLDHPYIVRVRDSGISEGQYYFAMDYVRGEPLDKYVAAKGLSYRQIVELFSKVCEAVAHAHQRGVIHRDLKPSNILVDDRGDPHVLDFGLAKAAGGPGPGASLISMTGEIRGTLSYMSPEQACGKDHLVDTRSDVYTLGVILYQLLTGQFPYDVSSSTSKTLSNIETAPPTPLRRVTAKLDSDIEAIVNKTLEKDPSRRYQSAAELRDEAQRWLDGQPIMAKAPSSVYLLRTVMRRHATAFVIGGLLLMILVGFSCTYYYLWSQLKTRNAELEKTVAELYEEREAASHQNAQLAFNLILDLWQKGLDGRVESDSPWLFAEQGRETQAVKFLLDGRPLSEKIDAFRRRLAVSEPFFTTFVIAEHHLRDGDRQKALELYDRALKQPESGRDMFLCYRIRKKAAELAETADAKDSQEPSRDERRNTP